MGTIEQGKSWIVQHCREGERVAREALAKVAEPCTMSMVGEGTTVLLGLCLYKTKGPSTGKGDETGTHRSSTRTKYS